MRLLPTDEHQIRKERILQAVVDLYIKTGKPVGSNTIVENYNLDLSPATIRNVLAELEKENFLTHPHTSAGRIPTDEGYRFFVNSITKVRHLAEEEEKRIQAEYSHRMQAIDDIMHTTTRALSALSQCTGFALTPSVSEDTLSRVDLIPLGNNQVLAVLVSETGMVQNQRIQVHQVPPEESLRRVARTLTERMKGWQFSRVQSELTTELARFQAEQLLIRDFIHDLESQLFPLKSGKEFFMEGTSKLLEFPEFQDYEAMRHFAHLVDERKMLGEILSRELSEKGLQIKIGIGQNPEFQDFSVVSTHYQIQGRPAGILGILGPKRMEYERMIAIVNTVAHMVNDYLNQSHLLTEAVVDDEREI